MKGEVVVDKVLFEYTKASSVAAQGGSPSGAEGYDIWWKETEEENLWVFLGFIPPDRFNEEVAYYQSTGADVYLKGKRP